MSKNVYCHYCGKAAILLMGSDLYPNHPETFKKYYWKCPGNCDAHVSAHHVTFEANGPLANRKLRLLRVKTHEFFDSLWKEGKMTRREAYIWLAKAMDMTRQDCHIAKFSTEDCALAKVLCAQKTFTIGVLDV